MRQLLALLCAAIVGSATAADDSKKRPNLLVLFSDDQRADTIGALGNPHVRTPNLDQLVKEGTSLTRAYCMGSTQPAVCVPSRAMLLSSRTLYRVNATLQDIPTWPELFGRAGYTTFMSGKWHNGPASMLRSFQHGKSIFFGGMGDPYTIPIADVNAEHKLTDKKPAGEHCVKLFADAAVDFIEKQKGDKPFLAYVAFNAPHDPRVAPKEYHAKYDPAKIPLPANYLPTHPFNNGEMAIRDEMLAPWPRTEEVVRRHLADYYAVIEHMDFQIGRILKALRDSGQYENTLIVFTSDHGLAIGSHGLFGKQNLYEHSMRSPLVIAGPGISKGKQSDAFCYLLDIFPTLGELCGVKPVEGAEGRSLAPVLAGKQTRHRESVFTAYMKVQRAVRDERWKLVVYPHINKAQLFDLKTDPAETKDVSSMNPKEVKRMTALLERWQKELGDTQALRSDKPAPEEFDFTKVKAPKK